MRHLNFKIFALVLLGNLAIFDASAASLDCATFAGAISQDLCYVSKIAAKAGIQQGNATVTTQNNTVVVTQQNNNKNSVTIKSLAPHASPSLAGSYSHAWVFNSGVQNDTNLSDERLHSLIDYLDSTQYKTTITVQ